MNVIAAVDTAWGIGKDGKLLVHIPEDMKFFRNMTEGKIVVMGRKTLESLPGGNPLPNRTNIVLSSTIEERDDIVICRSLKDLLKTTGKYDSKDIFIIGGGTVYRSLLDYCETAYITKVFRSFPSDTFFPDLDLKENWKIEDIGMENDWKGIGYRFCTYRNISPLV